MLYHLAQVLLLVWAVTGQKVPPVGSDYNDVNKDGSFKFGFQTGDAGSHYHAAKGDQKNQVEGRFGSFDPAQRRVVETKYTAGRRGFRARGPNIARKMDLSQNKIPYNPPVSPNSPNYNPTYDGYHDPNEDPSYSFQFRTPTYWKAESADSKGRVNGQYHYFDDIGERHDVTYDAGAKIGFNVHTPFPDSKVFNGLFYKGPPGKGGNKPRGSSSIQQRLDGSYRFVSSGPDQRRTEVSDSSRNVRGSYTYVDDKGQQRTVEYIAGPNIGYRIVKKGIGPNFPAPPPFIPPPSFPNPPDFTSQKPSRPGADGSSESSFESGDLFGGGADDGDSLGGGSQSGSDFGGGSQEGGSFGGGPQGGSNYGGGSFSGGSQGGSSLSGGSQGGTNFGSGSQDGSNFGGRPQGGGSLGGRPQGGGSLGGRPQGGGSLGGGSLGGGPGGRPSGGYKPFGSGENQDSQGRPDSGFDENGIPGGGSSVEGGSSGSNEYPDSGETQFGGTSSEETGGSTGGWTTEKPGTFKPTKRPQGYYPSTTPGGVVSTTGGPQFSGYPQGKPRPGAKPFPFPNNCCRPTPPTPLPPLNPVSAFPEDLKPRPPKDESYDFLDTPLPPKDYPTYRPTLSTTARPEFFYKPPQPGDSTFLSSNKNYFSFPHGVAVRAHIQSLDILPYGSRIPPPGIALESGIAHSG